MIRIKPRSSMIVLCAGLILLLLSGGLMTTSNGQGNSGEASKTERTVKNSANESDESTENIINRHSPTVIHEDGHERTFPELAFTLMVIFLALAALSMQFFLLKKNAAIQAEDSLRSFGVTLILVGTLFFITAGFDSEQIAPALGLFGTIAGYLLGKNDRKESRKNA